jgi:hypothetical protein
VRKNTITGNENDDIFSNDIETPVAHSSFDGYIILKCSNTTYSTSLSHRL